VDREAADHFLGLAERAVADADLAALETQQCAVLGTGEPAGPHQLLAGLFSEVGDRLKERPRRLLAFRALYQCHETHFRLSLVRWLGLQDLDAALAAQE